MYKNLNVDGINPSQLNKVKHNTLNQSQDDESLLEALKKAFPEEFDAMERQKLFGDTLLSDGELLAIRLYSKFGFKELNDTLRSNQPLSEKSTLIDRGIQSAIKKMNDKFLKTYRGSSEKDIFSDVHEGGTQIEEEKSNLAPYKMVSPDSSAYLFDIFSRLVKGSTDPTIDRLANRDVSITDQHFADIHLAFPGFDEKDLALLIFDLGILFTKSTAQPFLELKMIHPRLFVSM